MQSAGPPLPSISCSKSRIAPSPSSRRRHDAGAGAVAEQHARRAILVVDDARHHVGADDQRVLVRPARHNLHGRRQRVGERRAGGAQVEAPGAVRADLVLQQARRARKHHVGRHRADDDEPDVVGREAGARDGLERRLARRDRTSPRRDPRCAARGCRSAAESTRRSFRPASRDRRWSARAAARRSPATGSSPAARRSANPVVPRRRPASPLTTVVNPFRARRARSSRTRARLPRGRAASDPESRSESETARRCLRSRPSLR